MAWPREIPFGLRAVDWWSQDVFVKSCFLYSTWRKPMHTEVFPDGWTRRISDIFVFTEKYSSISQLSGRPLRKSFSGGLILGALWGLGWGSGLIPGLLAPGPGQTLGRVRQARPPRQARPARTRPGAGPGQTRPRRPARSAQLRLGPAPGWSGRAGPGGLAPGPASPANRAQCVFQNTWPCTRPRKTWHLQEVES